MAWGWLDPTGARDQQPIRVHSRRVGCRIPAESKRCVALAENTHTHLDFGTIHFGYLEIPAMLTLRAQHI